MAENIVKVPVTIIVALAGVSVLGYSISPEVAWPSFLEPLQKYLATHATGALAMTYVFGMMATFFVGTWLMRRYPIKRPKMSYAKNYFVFALPLAISSVIATIANSVDKLMIGYFWTASEVGYYFTVQRIIGFIAILYMALATILFPTISSQHAKKNIKGVIKTVHLSERYISMVLVPPLVFIIIFSKDVIKILLDQAFLPAAPVLIMLTIYTFVRGVTTPYSSLITGINKPYVLASISITVCLSNIVFNYLLIPKDGLLSNIQIMNYKIGISGATGAATATILAFLIPFFVNRFVAKRAIGIKLLQIHTIVHFIAGLGMGIVLYFIHYETSLFPVVYWYILFPLFALGILIYISILYLLKEFDKNDYKFFMSIINPKQMAYYIKDELKDDKKTKK
jgi:O-antigen/teichoic acid export membrane protein